MSKQHVGKDDTTEAPDSSREARFERVLREATALPLKLRLRLLDSLKSDAVVEREDGLRFSVQSLPEYRRARKQTTADGLLLEWISSFTPADVFFDVGANTGALSLLAARLHQGRVRVFAFEPAADTFDALTRNVLANDLGGVITPLPVALFDETGVKPLFRASLGAGSALHALDEAVDYARRPFVPAGVERVIALRLDDLVRWFGVPRPTRLKIDVDGVEARVLAGAAEVLRASACDIYIELVEAAPGDARPAEVTAFLDTLGYTCRRIVEHRVPGMYPRVIDGLFVPRSRAPRD